MQSNKAMKLDALLTSPLHRSKTSIWAKVVDLVAAESTN